VEAADPIEAAVHFAELYRRWAGAIPLDDLTPYQVWYQALPRRDGRTFRRQLAGLLIGRIPARDAPAVRRVVGQVDDWFPLDP
jgi:hypothetical protein